ncbi:AbrB/MazE/SpoVT family DNA-binding domain-containing protein [Rhizobium sp. FY34]|uniref:AbrB/MazE/SpoVT family DNA-binding domain-containing protein n=1 Tax=Rhizobium sp. FY34 TaxID=2562309 RepID=UPI0010C03B90|nr:AbrB/MazE/SpoVT family DNA-binding domain-containing protein [Rhizobium sp. FY34]
MKVEALDFGSSQGIVIPMEVLDRMGVKLGDQLELSEQAGLWFLKPIRLDATAEDDMERQLQAATLCMEKYKVAFRKLAD